VGARGYTGRELLRLLSRHARIDVAFVTSRELAGRPVTTEAPESDCTRVFEDLDPQASAAREVDAYVLALPNGKSAAYVAAIEAARPGSVIVDLSADHRFDDGWVYGQPERRRAAIVGAKRIANPGCYATALQLAAEPLMPFLSGAVHAFGVSGYSGAGTTPSPRNDPEILADSILPYALVDHLHEREVAHQLGGTISFAPHVAPFFRGLSVTISAKLARPCIREDLARVLVDRYRGERLVRTSDEIPTVRDVRDRHEVHIGGVALSRDGTHLALVAALDNLLAGAATTAIRNLNLALGLPELEGIGPWLS
jgi:N-acetyl-gamma-glutamyl-phosphate reductase common form